MTKNNSLIPINKQKLVEEIRELEESSWWKEYQNKINKSPLSTVARKKVINKSGSNHVSDNKESHGPMMDFGSSTSNSHSKFSIKFRLPTVQNGSGQPMYDDEENYIFELPRGERTTVWKINGETINELRNNEDALYEGRVKMFRCINPSERVRKAELEAAELLRKTIREMEKQNDEMRVSCIYCTICYPGIITKFCCPPLKIQTMKSYY